MQKQVRKYNPGFLTAEELVDSFCVRKAEFDLILDALRESTGNANSHQIVIGPRGSGKTTLLLRVAAELDRDAGLRSKWFPVIFAEESYEIATCGDFWLQCLEHLAHQAPREGGQADLRLALEEFRTVQDDRTLADRCLAAILDFADRQDKRLVLIVENLNTLFTDIGDPEVGWQLRKALQDEPRILLLGSATARFEEIDNASRALYDLFQVHALRRLTAEACATLWKSVSGRDIDARVVRSLQILTGGNPRLLVIVAQFGARLSFRELMKDLLNLVDDHTEYFRSHLEALSPQERRVYVALAILWKPATAKQVSDRARIPTSQCSTLLGRLVQRGAVVRSGGTRHRREYYLAERMYNIYYLLRASRGTDRVVEALVRFMASYYSPTELGGIRERISEEVAKADPPTRELIEAALKRLATTGSVGSEAAEAMHSADALPSGVGDLIERARQLQRNEQYEQSIAVCDEVELRLKEIGSPEADENLANALVVRSIALGRLDRFEASMAVCDQILDRYGTSDSPGIGKAVAAAHAKKVDLLGRLERAEDVLEASAAFLDRFESSDSPATDQHRSEVMFNKGVALAVSGQAERAHAVFDEVIRRFEPGDSADVQEVAARARLAKATLLDQQRAGEGALAAYDSVVDRFGSSHAPGVVAVVASALLSKAALLLDNKQFKEALAIVTDARDRLESHESSEIQELAAIAQLNEATILELTGERERARQAYDALVDRFVAVDSSDIAETVVAALVNKGNSLSRANRPEGAISAYDRVVEQYGDSRSPTVLEMVGRALVARAASEMALGQMSKALASVGEALERSDSEDLDLVVTAQMLKAEVCVELGARTDFDTALAAALRLLPQLPAVPDLCIGSLITFAARLGPEPVLELIQESPSDRILLPLVTALREELGMESKVAEEIAEVAKDIRRDLARLRLG